MPKHLEVRALTEAERSEIKQLAQAQVVARRTWQRARIIWLAHQGQDVAAVAAALQLSVGTVRKWLTRFNTAGVAGLADAPRAGGPPTYSPEQVGEVIATALTDPQTLGQPFGCWTLDRLAGYLHEARQIGMKRSRLSELLVAEDLRWRTEETWFSDQADPAFAAKRLDPAFAEKRGRSNG